MTLTGNKEKKENKHTRDRPCPRMCVCVFKTCVCEDIIQLFNCVESISVVFCPINKSVKVCYFGDCLYRSKCVSVCVYMCVCVRVSTLLTGDVVLCRWLPIQPVEICMSVCL